VNPTRQYDHITIVSLASLLSLFSSFLGQSAGREQVEGRKLCRRRCVGAAVRWLSRLASPVPVEANRLRKPKPGQLLSLPPFPGGGDGN
jgi:hypothetical protein